MTRRAILNTAGWCFVFVECLLCVPGLAATIGEVTITGVVPIQCGIAVQQEAGAVNIPDISAGNTGLQVATVTEDCNSPVGYTVTMQGVNSGNNTGLFVDAVSSGTQPFTVTYGGVSVGAGGIVTDSATTAFNRISPVAIAYSAKSTLIGSISASYAETLTFTVTAK